MSKSRLEAFSDGVIAVAITLLVLDISVPNPGPSPLHDSLSDGWPHYAAYVVSFVTIGIIWINHHAMLARVRRIDHTLMVLNLLLLMSVVLIPFATSLMAEYVTRSAGQHLAAGVYGGALLLMSVCFAATQRHILLVKADVLAPHLSAAQRRSILVRNLAGLGPYLVATALAPLSAYATLALCGAIAVFYALPIASSGGDGAT